VPLFVLKRIFDPFVNEFAATHTFPDAAAIATPIQLEFTLSVYNVDVKLTDTALNESADGVH
jgi:hypothetical protein